MLRTLCMCLAVVPGCAWTVGAQAAPEPGYRIETRAGRPTVVAPDGTPNRFYGISAEPHLQVAPMMRYLGFSVCHVWGEGPQIVRAAREAKANGVALAVLAPTVPDMRAAFRDGTRSGDHYPFQPAPSSAVGDFYNPVWQERLRAKVREFREALGDAREAIAIVWINNEPEYTRGWGTPWESPDFCIADRHTLAEFRSLMEQDFGTAAALNDAWNRDGAQTYAFTDWQDFEARALDELFRDWENRPLNPGAAASLHGRFIPKWLNDWQQVCADILRSEGNLGTALLSVRQCPPSVGGHYERIPTAGLDVIGINMYCNAFSDEYARIIRGVRDATRLPVVSSEWFVQAERPGDLGYVPGGDAGVAEQAVAAADLQRGCPGLVGEIWQAYPPCPDTMLAREDTRYLPHVYQRALLGNVFRTMDAPAEDFVLDARGYRSARVRVGANAGNTPSEHPDIVFRRTGPADFAAPCDIPANHPALFHRRGAADGTAWRAGAATRNSLETRGDLTALVNIPTAEACTVEIDVTVPEAAGACRIRLSRNGVTEAEWAPAESGCLRTQVAAAAPGPAYLTLDWDSAACGNDAPAVRALRVAVPETRLSFAPDPLLPEPVPDTPPEALRTVFVEAFDGDTLNADAWMPVTLAGEQAATCTVGASVARIEGTPGSRSGIATRALFPVDRPVLVEAKVSRVEGTNAILNLLHDGGDELLVPFAGLLTASPYKLNASPTGRTDSSRIEYGFSPGSGVWTWSVQRGIGRALPMGAPCTETTAVLRILREGYSYRFYIGDRLVARGLLADPVTPFRVFLYGFGTSRTEWDYVRVAVGEPARD